MKRILSPLALVFIALAAALALSPSANAQSTNTVQVKSGTNAKLALNNKTLRMVTDFNNDFQQRWTREKVTSTTFTLSRAGSLSCLRVAAGASSSSVASLTFGSCSGARAQWKLLAASGAGDLLVNVETNHAMIQGLCFAGSCTNSAVGVPRADVGLFEPGFRNWAFEILN
jgi:hypothetical protein